MTGMPLGREGQGGACLRGAVADTSGPYQAQPLASRHL
jgi:hypothetical protein